MVGERKRGGDQKSQEAKELKNQTSGNQMIDQKRPIDKIADMLNDSLETITMANLFNSLSEERLVPKLKEMVGERKRGVKSKITNPSNNNGNSSNNQDEINTTTIFILSHHL